MKAEAVTLNNNIFLNDRIHRITGYGRNQQGNSPNLLQTGITEFITRSRCHQYWGELPENQICILDPTHTPLNPGVAFASGDSGGPMTGFHGGGDVQYGVMSYADENCSPYTCPSCPDFPQIGTSIAHFIDQICEAVQDIGGDNEGCPRS